MNKLVNLSLVVVVMIMTMSCAVTDIDKKADFSKYTTFAWGKSDNDVDNPVYTSQLIDRNIKTNIAREFEKRGVKFDSANADVVVSYRTFTEEKQQVQNAPYSWGYYNPFFFRSVWFMNPWMFISTQPKTYTSGTLIVDIADRETGDLIWRGTVSGNVDNVKRLQKQLEKAVRAIMKRYPAVPGNENELNADKKAIS